MKRSVYIWPTKAAKRRLKTTTVNAHKIHANAKAITEAKLNEMLSGFSETQSKDYNQLISLGDSRELAACTVAFPESQESSNTYQIAYHS